MPQEAIRVLTIEDNDGDARLIQEMLDRASGLGWNLPRFELARATGLAAGLTCLEQGGIDVVLTDLDLPDSRTGDTFARLRAQAPHTPIVVLTGREDEALARHTVRAGAEDYLFKREMSGSLLAHALLYAIERQAARAALQQAHDELEQRVQERTAALEQVSAQREAAREALAASEQRLRLMVENLPAGAVYCAGETITFNHAVEEITGYSGDQVRTVDQWFAAIYGPDAAAMRRTYDEVRAAGFPQRDVAAIHRKDGSQRVVEFAGFNVADQDVAVWVLHDVTERQRAETEREAALEALRQSETRWQFALEGAGDGLWDWNVVEGKVYYSRQWKAMLGYAPEEIGDSLDEWDSRVHPADREQCYLDLNRHFLGETPVYQNEHRVRCKDGSYKWVLDRGKVIEWQAECTERERMYGRPLRVIGTHSDVTERKQAEAQHEAAFAALRQRTEVLDTILDNIPVMIAFHGPQHPHRWVNRCWQDTLGWSLAEAQSRDMLAEAYPDPEQRQKVRKFIAEAGGTWTDFRARTRDGRLLDTMWADVGLRNGSSIGIGLDITERKEAEAQREAALEALRTSEARYRALFEGAAMGIFHSTFNGRFLEANPTLARMYGYASAQELVDTVDDIAGQLYVSPQQRDEILAQVPADGETIKVEVRYRRKDGTEWDAYLHLRSGCDAPGQPAYLEGFVEDITERKRAAAEREKLQEQLAQAQKMEAVGRLAGGIAHDFNNMLGAIMGHAELAARQIDPGHPLYADLDEIRQAAQRSADLTRQLLAFARKQVISPIILDLNDTVAGMLRMLRRLIGEDIELAWLPGTGLWPVEIDPGQLNQILINLCLNAREAIAGVGQIIIETQNVVRDESYSDDRAGFAPGEYALMAVSDNGRGMDQATMTRLFEPYFTTKAEGQSGGLGLATVYGAVRMNQGHVHVYSEPGRGTTFRIYLPRAAGQVAVPPGSRPAARGGRETVLVVEDEPAILKLARTVLERLGYSVLATNRPGEALRQVAEHAGTIDLLITDVVMPEMNGHELAARLAALHPGIKCLFMSGYTANVIAHQGVLEEGVWFLQKPFSIDDLAIKVRTVLEQGQEQTLEP